jgi:hypothetical protein
MPHASLGSTFYTYRIHMPDSAIGNSQIEVSRLRGDSVCFTGRLIVYCPAFVGPLLAG